MAEFWTTLVALVLVASSVLIHYEVLSRTAAGLPRLKLAARSRILLVIASVLVAHTASVCVYAVAYYAMHTAEGFGELKGAVDGDVLDYFYFSIVSFTTLGVGDVYPQGAIRIISGLEALNGFVLIGWSASYTYLVLRNTWED